jgi:peptide/nickel transport system substrate-binding protein
MAKYFSLLVLATCLAGCFSAPESEIDFSEPGTTQTGGLVVEASLGEAGGLVNWLAGDSATSRITQHIYRSILQYDKNLSLQGDLAKNWSVSADGKEISFTLRDDIHWHDGKPVTTADVEATFKRVIDPNTRTPYAADYKLVDTFEAVDQHTFKVTYAEPFAPALMSWAGFSVLPKHVLEQDEDFNNTRLKTEPLGNYRFKIATRKLGQFTTLEDAKPTADQTHVKRWQIRVIPDQDTQFLELKAGNLDLVSLKPVQAARLSDGARFNKLFNKHTYLANGYTFLGFNQNHPILKEQLVRQALSYATPREQLINAVLFGQGQAAISPYKPGTWAYNDTLKPYAFDLEKAANLLLQAGFENKNGQLIRTVDGQKQVFEIRIVTNQGNDQRIKTAEILQHFWGKLGIKVDVRVQEWATFLENTLYPRDFDAFILGWSLTPNPDQFSIWHSSQSGPRQFNVIDYKSARVDATLEKARRTFNRAEQKRLYDEFQQILHEEQPYLFLYVPTATVATHKRIKNISAAPAGIMHNVEDWYIPSAQQIRMTP